MTKAKSQSKANIFTEKQLKALLDAFSQGANIMEASLEANVPYDKVIEWAAIGENEKEMIRLQHKPLWGAKKKVLEAGSETTNDARWLLTHHKGTKDEWGDRVEHTGKGGEQLLPSEKVAEINSAVDGL